MSYLSQTSPPLYQHFLCLHPDFTSYILEFPDYTSSVALFSDCRSNNVGYIPFIYPEHRWTGGCEGPTERSPRLLLARLGLFHRIKKSLSKWNTWQRLDTRVISFQYKIQILTQYKTLSKVTLDSVMYNIYYIMLTGWHKALAPTVNNILVKWIEYNAKPTVNPRLPTEPGPLWSQGLL